MPKENPHTREVKCMRCDTWFKPENAYKVICDDCEYDIEMEVDEELLKRSEKK
mgnify:CR=1 FL=1